jgi:hypothetical protein
MGKYDDMNLDEVRRRMARIGRDESRRHEIHSHCGKTIDDGPCGCYGESFASALQYLALYTRKQELEAEDRKARRAILVMRLGYDPDLND